MCAHSFRRYRDVSNLVLFTVIVATPSNSPPYDRDYFHIWIISKLAPKFSFERDRLIVTFYRTFQSAVDVTPEKVSF